MGATINQKEGGKKFLNPQLKFIFLSLTLFALIMGLVSIKNKKLIITSDIPRSPTFDWQIVNGTNGTLFVYSAYYIQQREARIIRVVGVGLRETKSSLPIVCNFFDTHGQQTSISVNATMRIVRENHKLKYSACYIECEIDESKVKEVQYVSVVSVLHPGNNTNILRIHFPPREGETQVDFSVCVKPMNQHITNILFLLEWIELHKLLGVEYFTFYNYSIVRDVSCVLSNYPEIEVLPWSIPIVPITHVIIRGQQASSNDCNFRHRGISKYVFHIDVDEVIVPSLRRNYSTLLEQLVSGSGDKSIGAYSFQNAFFFLQWKDDESVFSIEGNPLAERVSWKLNTARKTRRLDRFFPHGVRSKLIIDPKSVDEMGIHAVLEHVEGFSTQKVDAKTAYLHHYRRCQPMLGLGRCSNYTDVLSIVDNSCHTYTYVLAFKVASKLEEIATKCNLNIERVLDFH